jgi:hypothetical protein
MSAAPHMTERQQLAIALRESMTGVSARLAMPSSVPAALAARSPNPEEVRAQLGPQRGSPKTRFIQTWISHPRGPKADTRARGCVWRAWSIAFRKPRTCHTPQTSSR